MKPEEKDMVQASKFDPLLWLILKIEAVADRLQESLGFVRKFHHAIGAMFAIGVLWGMFFVPVNILQVSTTARAWMTVATMLFPWIGSLEAHWGVAAQKLVYLQSVYILWGAIPFGLNLLTGWEVRVESHQFQKELDQRIIRGLVLGFFMLSGVLYMNITVSPNEFFQNKMTLFVMFNYWLSPLAALMFAVGTVLFVFAIPLSLIYLIQYIRFKIQQILGRYHG